MHGRLGEWISIGGINQSSNNSDKRNLINKEQYNSEKSNIFVKVEEIKYVIQINGKLRGEIIVDKATENDAILIVAKENPKIQKHLLDKIIVKEILVPNKLINLVVR